MPESNMTTCPDCGKEVSKNAETCPHCGARLKKKEMSTGGIIGFLFFGALTVYFFMRFINSL